MKAVAMLVNISAVQYKFYEIPGCQARLLVYTAAE
jgi:hypothetical protein